MEKIMTNSIKDNKMRILKILFLFLFGLTGLFLIGCSEITTPEDVFPPGTPRNFTLIGGGDGQVHFRWEKNTEIDFKTYRLYRSEYDNNSFKKLVEINQNEYVDRFLEYDSTYYYYITAIDHAGNESPPTNIIDIQPLNISAPQPPSRLIVAGYLNPLQGTQEIRVSWTPPDIGDLKNYRIYRGNDSSFILNASTFIDSTNIAIYFDRTVQINQAYHYKIIAVDKGYKVSLPCKSAKDMILVSADLISPANNTRFGHPRTFKWGAVNNAVSYEVFVGNGPFSDVFWSSGKITSTVINYSGTALTPSKVYYWWVGAYSRNKIKFEDGSEIPAQINSYSLVNSFFSE